MRDQGIMLDVQQQTSDLVPRIGPEVLAEARMQRSHEPSRRAGALPGLLESGHCEVGVSSSYMRARGPSPVALHEKTVGEATKSR